jgi:hypothetical protein
MPDSSDTIDHVSACATCGAFLDKERFVQMEGTSLQVFCSAGCLRTGTREQSARLWAARRRSAKVLVIGGTLLGACLTPHQWPPSQRPPRPAAAAKAAQPAADPGRQALPPGWFGPDWPPTETSVLAALGQDAWLHPLAGPFRRMPRTDARVFGAVRPGQRAVECRNGHCGVDLGGEIWGEHIRAVHDGLVDRVQRSLNPQHGGRYVRLSHRGGTVFSQYFHLAAIPRGLERGVAVKAGQVIGLLGDTGVKDSAPHLHFTISIRLTEDSPEKYVDPEPLIALWPLRIPLEGSEVGLVSTQARPGVPLGSMPLRSARERRLAAKHKGGAADGASGPKPIPAQSEDAPASETESPEPSADE